MTLRIKRNSTGGKLFFSHVHFHGGPAPGGRYPPKLSDLIWNGEDQQGQALDRVAEVYRAINEHRAIKALLLP